jgi:predicted transcriptional regulator
MKQIEPEMLQLKKIINHKFGLDINVNTRKRDYVNARLVYAKILRERGYTHESIARSINKDHATVIYYVRCAMHIFMQDRFLEKKYKECRGLFFGTIDPQESVSTEDMLAERINTLMEQVNKLTAENELLNYEIDEKVKKFKRINKIINLWKRGIY